MKKLILSITFLMINISFAQNLNQYKYALVPSKFSFLKEKDQYHLNTLAKVYMKQYGFEAYFDADNQPDDFVNMNCNKVFLDVISNGGMFTTKLSVVLKDCKGNILYTSKEGSSREKEYAVAYNQALRMAFESMQTLNYKYTEVVEKEPVVTMKNKFENTSHLLYAKPITHGFEIINEESKVIMSIYKTSSKGTFFAIKDHINGVLISIDKRWFLEYYENSKLISEEINVAIDF